MVTLILIEESSSSLPCGECPTDGQQERRQWVKQELKGASTDAQSAQGNSADGMYRWTTAIPLLSPASALETGTPLSHGFYLSEQGGSFSVNPATSPSPKPRTYSADPSVQYGEGPVPKPDNIKHPAHYTQGGIQPLDFILANSLGFCAGNVVKYVTRYKHKGGKQDLLKAREYLNRLIEQEYP
jgi:hypothetical protein